MVVSYFLRYFTTKVGVAPILFPSGAYAVFCKKCGLIGYLRHQNMMPYKIKCPHCGVERKSHLLRHGNKAVYPKPNSKRIIVVHTKNKLFTKICEYYRLKKLKQ